MIRAVLIIAVILSGLFYWAGQIDKRAMSECEKTHSHSTCFYATHR